MAMLWSLLMTMVFIYAVPAKRGVWKTLTLGNGTEVRAQLVGDEHGHFWKAEDGQAYLKQGDVYVAVDAQQIIKKAKTRRAKVNAQRVQRRTFGHPTTILGQKKAIMILVNFNDLKYQNGHDNALFQKIANEENYNEGKFKGSMADYFKAQSRGKFELDFDVVGPVTVSKNQLYYGQNDDAGNDMYAGEMVCEAVKLAKEQISDWTPYDWDNDGYVDQVYVVYAGKGEADGGEDYTIWPHAYSLSDAKYYGDGTGPVEVGTSEHSLKVNSYGCGPELNGSTGDITGIGVMCHEYSHCLGYPDFYDIDYSGGQGMGEWDLMNSGSYNGDSYQPAGYTSYERWFAGWEEPIELKAEDVSVTGMKSLQDGGEFYIIYNDKNADEYYLLENRQLDGWDASLSYAGLLILHCDYDVNVWEQNGPNDDPNHQRMTVVPADGEYSYYTYAGTKNFDPAEPFPYNGVNAFNKNFKIKEGDKPAENAAKFFTKTSNGTYWMNGSVENITQNNDNTISFNYIYGTDHLQPDSTITGSLESPLTIAQVISNIDADKADSCYVKGVISKIDRYNPKYGSITYWISDDGKTDSQQFEIYSGKSFGGASFTDITDLEVGASVVVYGYAKKYTPKEGDPFYELDMNNVLMKYEAPLSGEVVYNAIVDGYMAPEFSSVVDENGIAYNVVDGQSVINVSQGAVTMTAVSGATPVNDEIVPGAPIEGTENLYEIAAVNAWNDVKWTTRTQGDINFEYILGTGTPYTSMYAEEIISDGEPTGTYRPFYTYYAPDGSSGMPVTGLYYKFKASTSGALMVKAWVNKGRRQTYVVNGNTMMPVEVRAFGYINGQRDENGNKRLLSAAEIDSIHYEWLNSMGYSPDEYQYVIGNGNQPFWGWLVFNVEAGEEYWLFQGNSQIGFGGFEFYEGKTASELVGGESIDPKSYNINVAEIENGTVTVDRTSAIAGETVYVTATPAEDYVLTSISITDAYGNNVSVTGNSFVMPECDVVVTANFAQIVDLVLEIPDGANISDEIAAALEGKVARDIEINLYDGGYYTYTNSIMASGSITLHGNGATIDASNSSEALIAMEKKEGSADWTEVNLTVDGVTILGLNNSLIWNNNSKYYLYRSVIVDNCVVHVANNTSYPIFDFRAGSTVLEFIVTWSTFYAPADILTREFYSSQSGQRPTEYSEDATQSFIFARNTVYNIAKGRNFFFHRSAGQSWMSFDIENNLFVDCGKQGQVISGFNGGKVSGNPSWYVSGNAFNFDGEDTGEMEISYDTYGKVENTVFGVMNFNDPNNGDFNGEFTLADGATVPLGLGDERWTIVYPQGLLMGDVDSNDEVNVTDAVLIIDEILGKNPSNFNAIAADVNYDTYINVTDVVLVIDHILGKTNLNPNRAAAVDGEIGTISLSTDMTTVSLTNPSAYTAFQMDVTLPMGVSLENAQLTERAAGSHSVVIRKLDNGSYRIIGVSMQNEAFEGTVGELLKLQLSGNAQGAVAINNVLFVTPQGVQHELAGVNAFGDVTGISDALRLNDNGQLINDNVFDLQGRRLSPLTSHPSPLKKGLYILDGKKQVVK